MDEERIDRARLHAHRLRELYVHATIYVLVMGGATLLNWVFWPSFWWVLFPAIGWGIGLVAHAVSVLFEDSIFGPDWEERKARELMRREEQRQAR